MSRPVFFDWDDTLLDFHAAERAALTATLRELDIDPAPAVVRQLERRLAANDALSDGLSPEHRFFTTGANERRAAVLRLLAGENARLEALDDDFQARTASFESMK